MKKWMLCMLAALLAVAVGCGAKDSKENTSIVETVSAVPTQTEANATEEPVKTDYSMFAGDYEDEYSQRAMMEAEEGEDNLHIIVSWSESAFAFYRWEMHAKLEGDRLVYSDCVQEYFASDDNPEGPDHKTIYTGGTGYFEWENGKLKWTGASDSDCRDCVFSK